MSKKVAVLVTDLVEDIEFTDPVKALKESGASVTTISFSTEAVTGKHGTKIDIDKSIGDVAPSDFDALFIPGGFSPDQLRADERFNLTKHFWQPISHYLVFTRSTIDDSYWLSIGSNHDSISNSTTRSLLRRCPYRE